VDFDHSANTCTGKSTIMSVIHSIAVSKVSGENLSVRVFSMGLLKQGCPKCVQPGYYMHKY